MRKRIKNLVIAMGTAGLVAFSAVSQASSFRYAVGFPPGTIGASAGKVLNQSFEEYTSGKHSINVFPLSLLNLKETPLGVRSGVVDGGFVILPYVFSDFRNTGFLLEMAMHEEVLKTDPMISNTVFTAAATDFLLSSCPECLREFKESHHVFTGYSASSSIVLLCRDDFSAKGSLAGARIRVGGGPWRRWVSEMGAQPVNISLNETYEGLEQGVVDCTVSPLTELTGIRLHEVVKAVVVDAPAGPGGGISINSFNASSWKKLNPDDREALMKASVKAGVHFSWQYALTDKANLEKSRGEWGIKTEKADEALREATLKFSREDLEGVIRKFEEQYEVSDAKEFAEEFERLIIKWRGRLDGVESEEEAFKRIWSETGAKLDYSKYGI